jgi:uncharacterized protein YndB with AHSA1/START domain
VKEGSMRTFEAHVEIPAEPSRVIGALTDPDTCRRFSRRAVRR